MTLARGAIPMARDPIALARGAIPLARDPMTPSRDPMTLARDPMAAARDALATARDGMVVTRGACTAPGDDSASARDAVALARRPGAAHRDVHTSATTPSSAAVPSTPTHGPVPSCSGASAPNAAAQRSAVPATPSTLTVTWPALRATMMRWVAPSSRTAVADDAGPDNVSPSVAALPQ